jgi:hypothetical protein
MIEIRYEFFFVLITSPIIRSPEPHGRETTDKFLFFSSGVK